MNIDLSTMEGPEYLEKYAKPVFTELAAALMKEKPSNVIRFMTSWCAAKEEELADIPQQSTPELPESDNEDAGDYMDDDSDHMKQINARMSVVKNRIAISGEGFNPHTSRHFVAPVYPKNDI